jgi:hypothetical protein
MGFAWEQNAEVASVYSTSNTALLALMKAVSLSHTLNLKHCSEVEVGYEIGHLIQVILQCDRHSHRVSRARDPSVRPAGARR